MTQEKLKKGNFLHAFEIPKIITKYAINMILLPAAVGHITAGKKGLGKSSKMKQLLKGFFLALPIQLQQRQGMKPIVVIPPLKGIPPLPVIIQPG